MNAGPQCWICRRRQVQCDGAVPTCGQCRASDVQCLGYGPEHTDAVLSDTTRADSATRGSSNDEAQGSLFGPGPHDASQSLLLVSQPLDPRYRHAQTIFEGLDYFNKVVCQDLLSDETHFNPYQVNLQRVDGVPETYVKILVSTAGFHRLMLHGPEPAACSALVQKDLDVFALRAEALRELNDSLSRPENQTSDATLLSVIALMITSIQASAYNEWRAHLEGARQIIQMRGGLKRIIEGNAYFKPPMTFLVIADVISATTTSSSHKDMPLATSMALKYWEVEPGFLKLVASTCNPCPEDLFQSIILVNYLRTLARQKRLHKRRQAGTRMVIDKILAFSPSDYAAQMRRFAGWDTTGKGVRFADDHGSPYASSTVANSPAGESMSDSPSASPDQSSADQDTWLSVATAYRAAVLLYAVRTLVVDSSDDATLLLPQEASLRVQEIRKEARDALAGTLSSVFSNQQVMYKVGRLVLWPLFILGMEVDHRDTAMQELFVDSFSMLSQAMGTMGPLGAVEELEHKWKIDAQRVDGTHIAWDDYFEGRDDYICF